MRGTGAAAARPVAVARDGDQKADIGNIQPRKNLDLLLSAYAELISEDPETPERLVLVGQSQYRADTILERAGRSGRRADNKGT